MKILDAIRYILITLIIAGFVFGISLGVCDEILKALRKTGGIITAGEILTLQLTPYLLTAFVLVAAYHLRKV
jgi:hypothetical protein